MFLTLEIRSKEVKLFFFHFQPSGRCEKTFTESSSSSILLLKNDATYLLSRLIFASQSEELDRFRIQLSSSLERKKEIIPQSLQERLFSGPQIGLSDKSTFMRAFEMCKRKHFENNVLLIR